MPFLRDEGPPVSKETIQRAREGLPLEYGFQSANETGREVLLVRVPKAKPDYLHDLADVAFYVTLDMVRSVKDVLLIGHEKTARLEPQLLRDAIRQQDREDVDLISDQRRRLGRDHGATILQSPSNHHHQALAIRIPKTTVKDFGPDDVMAIRAAVERQRARFDACQYAYVIADKDHERLGRRVLLELLGTPAATAAPLPPAALSPELTPTVPLAARLPPTPGAALAEPAAAAATAAAPPASGGPSNLPTWMRPRAPAPAAVAAPAAPPAPAQAPTPVAVQAPAPAPPTAAAPAPPSPTTPTDVLVDDRDEYAIISRPKPAAPAAPIAPPASTAPLAATPDADTQVHEEYEIVSKPKPVATPDAPAAAPMPEDHPDVERSVHVATAGVAEDQDVLKHVVTEAYEVYTSKPKARAQGPAITPPGQGGFQAALSHASGPAPARTKEYEIMGASRAPASMPIVPQHLPAPAAAPAATTMAPPFPATSAPPRPVDDPRVQPAFQTRPAAAPAPTPDNGVPIVATVAPANPELILAQRFREAQYEIVEGLRAQGTVFAFAAHKPNGRRVLVKRATTFGPDDAPALAQLVAALGADLCLVVADKLGPGARLATWGTRIEVCASGDVASMAF